MKKLTCHCGGVEAEVKIPENGFEKLMRCNCSICKRKGYVIGVIGSDDFKLIKGENLLTLYQFYTKTAKHYFCSICGIYTHHQRRSNPNEYSFNTGCIEGFKAEDYDDPNLIDGINHIKDRKEH